jgi:TATA-binding protein-associated factor Taf7
MMRSRMAALIIIGRLQYVITELRPGMVRRTDLSLSIVMEDVDEDRDVERRGEMVEMDGAEADDELSDESEEMVNDKDESDEDDEISGVTTSIYRDSAYVGEL